MGRLTKWVDGEPIEDHDNDTSVSEWKNTAPEKRFRNGYNHCMRKLAEYEDLQEQGRLVVLPCKVGDTVFVLAHGIISQNLVDHVEYDGTHLALHFHLHCGIFTFTDLSTFNLGDTLFLTREEAEAALAAKKGENHG